VGSWVQEMRIGGDLRLRYQYDTLDSQAVNPATGRDFGSGSQRSRVRLRLRIHDDFILNDNWFGGVELATSNAADSSNQTLGSGFGKYGIYISKAYLGWHASGDWLTLEAGKMANPFYTTDLVWDPDINPDGFVEILRFDKMFLGGGDIGSYSKDGKSVAAKEAAPAERPWTLGLNLGEFIFSDNIENGGRLTEPGLRDNDVSDDAWLFEAQLLGSYKTHGVKVTFAPAFMFYNSASLFLPAGTNSVQFSDTSAAPSGGTAVNAFYLGETRDLAILTAPGDISFKLWGVPTKFYWDFAWNTRGKERDDEVYGLLRDDTTGTVGHFKSLEPHGHFTSMHQPEDDFAYLLGLQVGENKKAGDLSMFVNWRQTGIASVDPNINDSDFALSELNTRGIKSGLTYNVTDFATLAATYYYAWNLRDNLVGGFATVGSSAGVANANVVHVFQLDLNVKF